MGTTTALRLRTGTAIHSSAAPRAAGPGHLCESSRCHPEQHGHSGTCAAACSPSDICRFPCRIQHPRPSTGSPATWLLSHQAGRNTHEVRCWSLGVCVGKPNEKLVLNSLVYTHYLMERGNLCTFPFNLCFI